MLYTHPLPPKPSSNQFLGEDVTMARLRQHPTARANPFINYAHQFQHQEGRKRATFFGGPVPADTMPSLADLEGRLLIRQESVIRELREGNRPDATFAQIMYQNRDMATAKKNGWVFKDEGGGNFTFYNKSAPVSTSAKVSAKSESDAFSMLLQVTEDLAKSDPNKPLLSTDVERADVDTEQDYRTAMSKSGKGVDKSPMLAESVSIRHKTDPWMRLPEDPHDDSVRRIGGIGPNSLPFDSSSSLLEGDTNGTKGRARLGLSPTAPNHEVKAALQKHLDAGKSREDLSTQTGVPINTIHSWLDNTWAGEKDYNKADRAATNEEPPYVSDGANLAEMKQEKPGNMIKPLPPGSKEKLEPSKSQLLKKALALIEKVDPSKLKSLSSCGLNPFDIEDILKDRDPKSASGFPAVGGRNLTYKTQQVIGTWDKGELQKVINVLSESKSDNDGDEDGQMPSDGDGDEGGTRTRKPVKESPTMPQVNSEEDSRNKKIDATSESETSSHSSIGAGGWKTCGSTSLPIAPLSTPWDKSETLAQIAKSSDKEKADLLQKVFLCRNSSMSPDLVGAYKLPFAAFIDGKWMAIPQALSSVNGVLAGAMGGVDIPAEVKSAVQRKIAGYEKKIQDMKDQDQGEDNQKETNMKESLLLEASIVKSGTWVIEPAYAEIHDGRGLSWGLVFCDSTASKFTWGRGDDPRSPDPSAKTYTSYVNMEHDVISMYPMSKLKFTPCCSNWKSVYKVYQDKQAKAKKESDNMQEGITGTVKVLGQEFNNAQGWPEGKWQYFHDDGRVINPQGKVIGKFPSLMKARAAANASVGIKSEGSKDGFDNKKDGFNDIKEAFMEAAKKSTSATELKPVDPHSYKTEAKANSNPNPNNIKVGDKVFVSHVSSGGTGTAGIVTKIDEENGKVSFRAPKDPFDKYGAKTYEGNLKNAEKVSDSKIKSLLGIRNDQDINWTESSIGGTMANSFLAAFAQGARMAAVIESKSKESDEQSGKPAGMDKYAKMSKTEASKALSMVMAEGQALSARLQQLADEEEEKPSAGKLPTGKEKAEENIAFKKDDNSAIEESEPSGKFKAKIFIAPGKNHQGNRMPAYEEQSLFSSEDDANEWVSNRKSIVEKKQKNGDIQLGKITSTVFKPGGFKEAKEEEFTEGSFQNDVKDRADSGEIFNPISELKGSAKNYSGKYQASLKSLADKGHVKLIKGPSGGSNWVASKDYPHDVHPKNPNHPDNKKKEAKEEECYGSKKEASPPPFGGKKAPPFGSTKSGNKVGADEEDDEEEESKGRKKEASKSKSDSTGDDLPVDDSDTSTFDDANETSEEKELLTKPDKEKDLMKESSSRPGLNTPRQLDRNTYFPWRV